MTDIVVVTSTSPDTVVVTQTAAAQLIEISIQPPPGSPLSGKDVSNGYPGLTLLKLNLKNAANTFTNWLTNATTAARTWTMPDKSGTVAMTSDITGTNSGTNTGDQTITLTGNVTGSGTGSFAATIAAKAVTLAKMDDMATASLIYRKTAATGAPEVNTLATLKTDLGLTNTNSGDNAANTSIVATPLDTLAATTDITTLNASTSAHGLLLKATAPATGLYSYVGITYGETVYTNKPLFDATAPSTQAFGDAAAVGTAVVAARRDHKHAMMAAPTSVSGNAGTVTGLAVTAGQTLTVTVGGTIGSAAYTASTAYDAAGAAAAVTPNTLGLVIGTNVQAYNANLTAINQALTTTSSPSFTTVTAALTGNASTASAVAVGGITGLGTGIATALAVNAGSAGAPILQGAAASVTTLTASGDITVSKAIPNQQMIDSGTAQSLNTYATNGFSKLAKIGIENATGGSIFTGSYAYAAVFGSGNGAAQIAANNVVVATFEPGGAVTIPGATATGALTVTGALSATTTIKTGGYTVATLPAGTIGMRTYVTDALAPTFLATIVGGGAVVTPVFYNGTNWVAE